MKKSISQGPGWKQMAPSKLFLTDSSTKIIYRDVEGLRNQPELVKHQGLSTAETIITPSPEKTRGESGFPGPARAKATGEASGQELWSWRKTAAVRTGLGQNDSRV